jgi:hypothetical protein
MKKFYALFFVFGFTVFISKAQCPTDSLEQYIISAHQTDPNIPSETQKHYVYINRACTPKNILLVYLGGTAANPSSTQYFPAMAANNGFYVVNLKYPNNVSAQVPCRNSPDADCYENFRKEILEGIDYSPNISVDVTNSVYNRLLKLLIYLHGLYPADGWNQYYSGNNILWDHINVAGHSQGGGHVAMIAKDHTVKRVLMFASPNDYSDFFNGPALWTTKPHDTPSFLYYAFGNVTDEIVDFNEQLQQWDALGLDAFPDTVSVDSEEPPYQFSHQLYTSYDPPGNSGNHNSVVVDAATPLALSGTPEFEPAWKYMLGVGTPKLSYVSSQNFDFHFLPAFIAEGSPGLQQEQLAGALELLLFDISGKVILRDSFSGLSELNSIFQKLNSGFYLYAITDENGRVVYQDKLFVPLQ